MLILPESLLSLLEKADEMDRPQKPVSPQDIEEFERAQNVRLPDALKFFWERYGSRALGNKAIFGFKARVEFPNGKKKMADVGFIASPSKMNEALQRYVDPLYNNSGARLPERLYPLTFDDGYGHCLIDLNENTYGRILYLKIKAETFGSAGYGWDQVGFVADTFEQFVAGLTPDYL
ncbi:SMI1/KNR4 family protein SUKH-1 [Rhizobium sp. PP-F2F-G48]|uniref:SMI1/KNR4 family protein n=1 Tax=Rhizobium sp. PP-F2F-G48 TaxID=2135651 RepID=UPI0010EB9698|nr:SMI1/KNR4 family protein [Rhizobium sp. PP-F2F-G48]TCM53560.1 SMI1/KNR4 family protein SUKH-1 [Rhizobium sp. PP-F2F-G48]